MCITPNNLYNSFTELSCSDIVYKDRLGNDFSVQVGQRHGSSHTLDELLRMMEGPTDTVVTGGGSIRSTEFPRRTPIRVAERLDKYEEKLSNDR